jgi:hypothetical protein
MDWLVLAGLGIVWAVFLFPPRRRKSARDSVEEFERNMGLLAETGRAPGRWIVAPRKEARFMGRRERARARAMARRRRVLVVLLEAILLTGLIGLVPPLHPMWFATATLGGLLVVYVGLLIAARNASRARPAPRRLSLELERYHIAPSRMDELGRFGDTDLVHVIVRPAPQVQAQAAQA